MDCSYPMGHGLRVAREYAARSEKRLFAAKGDPERGKSVEGPIQETSPGGTPDPPKTPPQRIPDNPASEFAPKLIPSSLGRPRLI